MLTTISHVSTYLGIGREADVSSSLERTEAARRAVRIEGEIICSSVILTLLLME